MKRYLFFTLLLITGKGIYAQVIPNTSTSPSSVSGVHTIPSAYDAGMKVNYIRSWEVTKPYTSESDVISGSRTIQEVKQTTQYLTPWGVHCKQYRNR
ncbi:MAG: hypothetical protein IPO53_11810 [Chitinophagaceae bacterium]|nr:hypothetical protein [Chitinophagaceae bacterium]